MRFIKSFFCLSLILITPACGLLQKVGEDSKKQSITINAPLAEGTKCGVTDARGNRYNVYSTPQVIVVRQGYAPLTFICEKKGYEKNISYVDDNRIVQATVNLPDELAGIVSEPFARVATEFPREVAIWMKPNEWESQEHLRAWAFEKSLYDHKLYLLEQKKLEAYRKLEEERKFFKNWANNKKDKWERKEAQKHSGMTTTHDPRQEKEDAFMDEWTELKKRFNQLLSELKSEHAQELDDAPSSVYSK